MGPRASTTASRSWEETAAGARVQTSAATPAGTAEMGKKPLRQEPRLGGADPETARLTAGPPGWTPGTRLLCAGVPKGAQGAGPAGRGRRPRSGPGRSRCWGRRRERASVRLGLRNKPCSVGTCGGDPLPRLLSTVPAGGGGGRAAGPHPPPAARERAPHGPPTEGAAPPGGGGGGWAGGGGGGGHVDRSILPPRAEDRPTAETQVTGAGPGGRPGPGRGEGSREGEATAS